MHQFRVGGPAGLREFVDRVGIDALRELRPSLAFNTRDGRSSATSRSRSPAMPKSICPQRWPPGSCPEYV
jgi:hypothetical protein